MNQSLLLAASDVEEKRTKSMYEVDVALLDLISGGVDGGTIKCPDNDYCVTITDGEPKPKVDCRNS